MTKSLFTAVALITAVATSACNGGGEGGTEALAGSPSARAGGRNGDNAETVGEGCQGKGGDQICIGVNYVSYKSSAGAAVASAELAGDNMRTINDLWSQCGIAFQIESYDAVAPREAGLAYNTSNMGELDSIRRAYANTKNFLIANTGSWTGGLQSLGASGWTQTPGAGVYGVVVEARVKEYPWIIAHELGHYLGLDHIADTSNVMNAQIYRESVYLNASQCEHARQIAKSFWKPMLR